MKHHKRFERRCLICNKPQWITVWYAKANPTCSKECGIIFRTKVRLEKKCLICEKVMLLTEARYKVRITCSVECQFKYQTKRKYPVGEQSYAWKGGRTSYARLIRSLATYRNWRTAVFERDNYTCVLCGNSTSGNLNADHIKPFIRFPELVFDVNNGRTLCVPCHKKTDTYGKKALRAVC